MILIALLLCLPMVSFAWKPKISYGLEWGYTGTFLKTSQHNFICAEGYRIIDNPSRLWYYSNGAVLANVGVDLGGNWNLGVYSGLLGVYSRRWMVPLELRAKWFPSGLGSDGLFLQGGAALAFPAFAPRETGMRGLLGVGYRIALFRHLSADLMLSWNLTQEHENIVDPDTKNLVPRTKITSNTTEYQGINISLGINF